MTREEKKVFVELYDWVIELAATHGHAKMSEKGYALINEVTDRASKIISERGKQ